MKAWLPYCNTFLQELLCHEGLISYGDNPLCSACESVPGTIRCSDCIGGAMLCKECIVKQHNVLPLHCIKVCV